MSAHLTPDFNAVLAAGVRAQQLVPGAVAVGGTAAAIYAKHRFSGDTDHLLADLSSHFQEVRELLERDPHWATARLRPPVLILGSIDGVEVGFRQSRRRSPIETRMEQTPFGELSIPTLDEMIGMKAYMAYSRNATRDFVDLAALIELAGDSATLGSLMRADERYGHLQSSSVRLGIAERLTDPHPYDLAVVDLAHYKGLIPRWRQWAGVAEVCKRVGVAFGAKLILTE